jgi:signal transduction histidine kinase
LVEADRLGRVVTQLLDLCREDHGLTALTHHSIRLDELTLDVVDLMQVAAHGKGLRLDVKSITPCLIHGDADRLRQLLINLLDNAIKYTPAGGHITIRGARPNGRTSIEVVDTGVGIPADHLPHIFERFYRVDASRCRDTEGTGLGLSICRAIAEAHQGELRIESKAGQGTTVILTLPREDASSQAASVSRASRNE